jgi:acyl carrier protein
MDATKAADRGATLNRQGDQNTISEPEIDYDLVTVARAIASVLELKSPVAPDDDFFHLGGDSLAAAALMVEIEREYGVHMSIAVLSEASTPRALASAIVAARDERRVGSALVSAKVTGNGTPLFCVHGLRGESTFPLRLSRAMKGDRPVYGFRALGLEANERPLSSVEAMATLYLATAKSVQPTGPYLISGHCHGALVAYEMAQQLAAAGEALAGVILLDPPINPRFAPFMYKSGPALAGGHRILTSRAANVEAMFANGRPITIEHRRAGVEELVGTAVARYVPAPLQGQAMLICSRDRKETLGAVYLPLLSQCDFVVIDTIHKGLFTEHLADLADNIDRFADRVT